MRIKLLMGITLAAFVTTGACQDSVKGMHPVSPKLLWSAFPAKLKEWKMTKSTGELGIADWLESCVLREFERPIPPDPEVDPAAAVPPPMWTRIRVIDTGKYDDATAQFRDFSTKTKSDSDNVEQIRLHGWPTFVTSYDDGLIVARMLVADRFRVEFALKHQPRRNLDVWSKHMDYATLSAVPDTDVLSLPELIPAVRIDEMNPRRNRSYVMALSSDEELEKLLEEEYREMEIEGLLPDLTEEEERAFYFEGEDMEIENEGAAAK